jgi:hypothetical protein
MRTRARVCGTILGAVDLWSPGLYVRTCAPSLVALNNLLAISDHFAFAVACFDLEFDWRPFDRLRMLYDGFASMRPAPSRGFVTTFYVTYGA